VPGGVPEGVVVKELNLSFPCGQLMLEGCLTLPDAPRPTASVVLCHAHPLYGGSMDSNVLDAVTRALTSLSIATFKFNFRGVGNSEGSFGGGIEEQHDLEAALEYVASRAEIDPKRMGATGYSFGAMVALPVARRDARIKALVLISPAVPAPDLAELEAWGHPSLVICGELDDFVPAAQLGRLPGRVSGKPSVETIAGADHFWWGRESSMAEAAAAFFARTL